MIADLGEGLGGFPYLTEDAFRDLVAERAPWFEAAVGEMIWSVAVRFENRLVESFGSDNVWLAGDSAHLAGPVGGHSMNVGMREVQDLSRRITSILREGEPRRLLAVRPPGLEARCRDGYVDF